MPKPSVKLDWNSGGANRTDPGAPKRALGFITNEYLPSGWANWILRNVSDWIGYVDGLTAEALTWTALQTHSAAVTINGVLTTTAGIIASKAGGNGVEGSAATANTAGVLGYGTSADGTVGQSTLANGVVGNALGGTANLNTRGAVKAINGHIWAAGGNPAATTAFTNYVTPTNIVKAWGRIAVDNFGTPSIVAGFNIGSVAYTGGGGLSVTFAAAMASEDYFVMASATSLAATKYAPIIHGYMTANNFTLGVINAVTDAGTPLPQYSLHIHFMVLGAQ